MPEAYNTYDTAKINLPPNFKPKHPFDNGELNVRDEWLAGYPRSQGEIKANLAAYYGMTTHTDAQIGRILDALEKSGQYEHTIIVFASDNGLAVGQHGLMGKQSVYEHSVGVPLVIAGPGLPKQETREQFSYLIDIFLTLCDLAGLQIPSTVMGESLVPALKNPSAPGRRSLFFAYKHFQRAVRDQEFKLIKYNVKGKSHTQLFNLKNDPYETRNLADDRQYAERLHKMENLLNEAMQRQNDPAEITKANWGVTEIPSWAEVLQERNPKALSNLKELAQKERQMRGFK